MVPPELVDEDTALDKVSGAVPLYPIVAVVALPVKAKIYLPGRSVTVPWVHDASLAPPAVRLMAAIEHFTLPDASVIAQL